MENFLFACQFKIVVSNPELANFILVFCKKSEFPTMEHSSFITKENVMHVMG